MTDNVIPFPTPKKKDTAPENIYSALNSLDKAIKLNEKEKNEKIARLVVNKGNINPSGILTILPIAANDTDSLPNDRLSIALDNLNKALEIQKKAVANWKASLADLKESVQGLGDSFKSLDKNLSTINAGLSKIGEQSLKTVEIIEKSGL